MSNTNFNKRIEELSKKWLNGTLTDAEKEEYDRWYRSFEDNEVNDLSEEDFDDLENHIYASIQNKAKVLNHDFRAQKHRKTIGMLLAAASIILCFVVGLQIYQGVVESKQSEWLAEIKPGRDRATLRLNDGSVYDLDSLQLGQSIDLDEVKIKKSEDGQLTYSVLQSSPKRAMVSTISTPRGGQYKVLLPDGSVAWLNAASELTFPSVFNEKSRSVELRGEAYFEVKHNRAKPFRVITPTEEIEVLGTHFNVKAYDDEGLSNVALLEGSVRVSVNPGSSKILKPGQQSVTKSGKMRVEDVDVSEAIAWKNGEFMFQNESLVSAMQKIARWYGVEIDLEPGLEDRSIWGSVSKYENIKEVLSIVEMASGAKFKIEERRVYVTK